VFLVGAVDIDERTHELVRFASRTFGVSESEVIARAVRGFSQQRDDSSEPARDPWEAIAIIGEYDDRRVEGLYLPATQRVTVTTEPVAGGRFKSPSGAARAVVAALNPGRSAPQTNGWKFWHIASTGERLEVLRR
jgi:hypothetical protein